MANKIGWFNNHRVPKHGSKSTNRLALGSFSLILIIGLVLATVYYFPNLLSPRKRVLTSKTANSATYKVDEKQYATKIYPQAKWYKDSSGKWQDIDTSLEVEGNKISTKGLPFSVSFSKQADKPLTFALGKDSISFSPVILKSASNEESRAIVSKDKVTYYDIYKNTNLERVITPQGLKQSLVLTKPGHPESFSEKILSDMTVKKVGDGSLAYYEGSKVLATSPKPHLVDAKGKKIMLSYALSRDKLTIALPSLKGLSYPITIDPSIFHTLPDFQTGTSTNVDTSTSPVRLAEQSPGVYYSSGTLESSSIDVGAGDSARITSVAWETSGVGQTTQPANTELKFQIAANNDNATWNHIGPDGTAGTYFTQATGHKATAEIKGRYIRYKAYFSTTDTGLTPFFNSLTLTTIDIGSGSDGSATVSGTVNIVNLYEDDNVLGVTTSRGVDKGLNMGPNTYLAASSAVPNFDSLTVTDTGVLTTSSKVKLELKVSGVLTVATGGKIDVSGKGYVGGIAGVRGIGGRFGGRGEGPGGGTGSAWGGGGGGGYGGAGG
ncbi:MAG: hypothetical protein E3J54_02925, partial [Actinobacteria bacterium]